MNECKVCLIIAGSVVMCAWTASADTIVRKEDYGSCGQVSLYCAARRAGLPVTWQEIGEQLGAPNERQQHSFADIAAAASRLKLNPVAIEVGPQWLSTLPVPAIAHMRYPSRGPKEPHFVTILDASSPRGVWLIDPPFRAMQVAGESFQEASTNRFLVLAKTEQEAKRIRDFYGSRGESRALFALVVANAILGAGSLCYWMAMRARRMVRVGGAKLQTAARYHPARPRWQVVLPAIGLVGAAVGAFLFGPRGIKSAPPDLELSRQSIDLGVVMPGTQSVDIRVRNRGGASLQFTKPTTSCNCTQPEMPETLQPGAEGLLKLKVSVSPGQGTSDIVVHSNDPAGPRRIHLSWVGMAKPILWPSRVICQTAPLNKDYYQNVALFCTKGHTEDTEPEIILFRSSPAVDVSLVDERYEAPQGNTETEDAEPQLMTGVDSANFMRKRLVVRVSAPEGPAVIAPRCWVEIKYKTFTHKIDIPVAVRFVRDVVPRSDEIVFSDVTFSGLKGMKRIVPLDSANASGQVTISKAPLWLKSTLVQSSGKAVALEVEVSDDVSAPCDGTVVLQTPEGEIPIIVRLFALK